MILPTLVCLVLAGSRAPIGVPAFTQIERLPYLQPNVQTHEFTSYDRAGDNYDADYFPIYTEPNGENVLFDSYGPGCLYRLHANLWNGDLSGVNIRFYFDGESKPRIDMDVTKFFSPDNPLGIFKEPMAHIGGGYRVLYHPFFYAKRLKIALSKEPLGTTPGWDKLPWLGRYDKHPYRRNHWYEFTYHTYVQNPGITSWTKPADMSSVAAFWDPAKIGQPVRTYRGAITSPSNRALPSNATLPLLSIRGAETITALKFNIGHTDPAALFDIWLTIRFDGAKSPQVDVPIGCFFGLYRWDASKRIASKLVGSEGSEMYCYLPMPFWKGATVSLSNRGKHLVGPFSVYIEHVPARYLAFSQSACGTFHAIYHPLLPAQREGHDYRYADLHGQGVLVGHMVYRKNTSMEEDERTYFDGSRSPWITGEGFEDDQNQGWGLRDLQRAMWGSVASYGGAGAPWRFYIPELYVFQSSVRAGHQVYGPHSPLGHEGMYQVGEEESVAFAYMKDQPALKVTDEFAVGNQASRTAHRYRVLGSAKRLEGSWWYDGEENNVLFPIPPVRDSGIATSRGSEFTARIDPANQGVRLRLRTDKENNQQLARVYVDGRLVTERPWYSVDFERTFRGIRWTDSDFEISPLYTQGRSSIRIRTELVTAKLGVWEEFRYWVFSRS